MSSMGRFRHELSSSPHFTSQSQHSNQSNHSTTLYNNNNDLLHHQQQQDQNINNNLNKKNHDDNNYQQQHSDDFYIPSSTTAHIQYIPNQPQQLNQQLDHHQQQQLDHHQQALNHHDEYNYIIDENNNNQNNINYYQQRRWYTKEDVKNYIFPICGLNIPSIRQFALFHYFQFFTHIFVLLNATISALLRFIDPTTILLYRFIHICIIFCMILIDLYMSYIYYKQRKYAPYSIASPLLYIKQSLIILPNCPDVLFLSDKLGLLCQGYLFVVLPYLNILTLIYTPEQSSQQQSFNFISSLTTTTLSTSTDLLFQIRLIFIYIVLFQLLITLWTWVTFCLFYTVFLYEILLRTIFFILCCFRTRKYTTIIHMKNNHGNNNSNSNNNNNDNDDSWNNNRYQHDTNNNETQLLLPKQQQNNTTNNNANGNDKIKFISKNVYHNHYAYQQYHLNKSLYKNYNSINNNNSFDSNNNNNNNNHNSIYKIRQYQIDQQEFIPTTPYRNHILVSHISDPLFHKPYEWLWIIM